MAGSSPADLRTPTPPGGCALAIALPLTAQAFAADLEAGPAMDYSRGLLGVLTPEATWRDTGAPLAELVLATAAEAAAAGITVVREAGLAELGHLFAAFPVVIVVAHWRGHRLVAGDLRLPAAAIARRIMAGGDEAARGLGQHLDGDTLAEIAEGRAARPEVRLAALLDGLVAGPSPAATTGEPAADAFWRAACRRTALDGWWPEAFRPGNRLELRDGLQSAEAVAAAVPEGWTGIADFAVCHSMLLAETVKAGRPERRVMMRERRLDPRFYLQLLRRAVAEIARGDRNYAAVLLALYRELAARGTGTTPPAGLWRRLAAGLGL